MAQMILRLSEYSSAVDEFEFSHPLLNEARVSRRGKGDTPGFLSHSFQWTTAVRALTVLCLKTKAREFISEEPEAQVASLYGGAGSLAATLDYALSKKPLWLLDLFGLDTHGDCLSRRMFVRWNPERKRGGNVLVAFNNRQLSSTGIEIFLGNMPLESAAICLELAQELEDEYLLSRPETKAMEVARTIFA